ncbi:MAG: ribonuclease H-like YkuK family protein [Candidatus Pacebacteria bacterium]|nr:ribonuclease H-like YkuK family protein [Candidatus Paceibacterota bacterium]
MSIGSEIYFYNPTKGSLSTEETIEEMISYMREKPERFYDIIVGCDSSSEETPNFPVVVAILRVGEGGRFFLKKITYPVSVNKKFSNWKNRILEEVLLSCEMALFLKEIFNKKIEPLNGFLNYQFQYIHADIGENGRTKDMIKELTGLIRGNGFEPKIKPESYIASVVADKYS